MWFSAGYGCSGETTIGCAYDRYRTEHNMMSAIRQDRSSEQAPELWPTQTEEEFQAFFGDAYDGAEAQCQEIMATLDLRRAELYSLLGDEHVASVSPWSAPVVDNVWQQKLHTVSLITKILHRELREGRPRIVVRRPATLYGGLNMLELIASNKHEWLLQQVETMFECSIPA